MSHSLNRKRAQHDNATNRELELGKDACARRSANKPCFRVYKGINTRKNVHFAGDTVKQSSELTGSFDTHLCPRFTDSATMPAHLSPKV